MARKDHKDRLARIISGKRRKTTADEVIPEVKKEEKSWEKIVEEEILRIWRSEGAKAIPNLAVRLKEYLRERGAPAEVLEGPFIIAQVDRVLYQGGLLKGGPESVSVRREPVRREPEPDVPSPPSTGYEAPEAPRASRKPQDKVEGGEKAEDKADRKNLVHTSFRVMWPVWQRIASYCVLNRTTISDTIRALIARIDELGEEEVYEAEANRGSSRDLRFRLIRPALSEMDLERLRWYALEKGVSMSAVLETLVMTYLPSPDPDLATIERLPKGRPRKKA